MKLVDEIDAALRAAGTRARAAQEKRYLKSALVHYGVTMPEIRRIAKRLHKAEPSLSRKDLVALVEALWAEPVHERRMAVVELLVLYGDRLIAADLALLERLIRESKTWALVDGLSANVVGALVARVPALLRTLDRWSRDDDFWVRRAALLALLVPLRAGEGDFERFTRYADRMLDEKEFFIRKAIGWILRETSKKRPDLVYAWILPRAARASGVTLRETEKYLSARQRETLRNKRAARA